MPTSYLIIGGGIAGLYCAYRLHQKLGTTNIIVIEKSDRLGGRIKTKHLDNGTTLEMGASRIANVHTRVLSLVKEFGLADNISGGGSGRSYLEISQVSNKFPVVYSIDKIVPLEETDFYQIINSLHSRLTDDAFRQMAVNYSFQWLIEKLYGLDKANQMRNQFGYDCDFLEQNAIDALEMFQKTFAPGTIFHGLNGGLDQIIDRLAIYLKQNSIEIRLESECINIARLKKQYACALANKETIVADNIIFAIPKMNLLKIKYLASVKQQLNSVVHKPLLRIYAYFPTNNRVWFDHLDRVTTVDTIVRQIIPIDPSQGLVMIYCDGNNAKSWYYLQKKNVLKKELTIHLRKLFGNSVPEPTKILGHYCDSATHLWKPSVNSELMTQQIMQPMTDEHIYIVGEAYSMVQEWIEGALEMVDRLVEKLAKEKVS